MSKRARAKEFAALTDDETRQIEQAYSELFGVEASEEIAR